MADSELLSISGSAHQPTAGPRRHRDEAIEYVGL